MDRFSVPNPLSVIMATNSEWSAPAGSAERRYACFDVGDARAQDFAYFGAIRDQMRDGGTQGLLWFLLQVDLEALKARGIDPKVVPKTEALAEQQLRTLRGIDRFLWDWVFQTADWPKAVVTKDLYQKYAKGEKHPESEDSFGRRLKNALSLEGKKKLPRTFRNAVGQVESERAYGYDLPQHAEAKKRLAGFLKMELPEEEDAPDEAPGFGLHFRAEAEPSFYPVIAPDPVPWKGNLTLPYRTPAGGALSHFYASGTEVGLQ